MNRLALLSSLSLAACFGPPQTTLPELVDIVPATDVVRLVFIGDTGDLRGGRDGRPDACDPGGGYVIDAHCRERVREAIAAEGADAIVALGDLVYANGPVCPEEGLTDKARDTLDGVLGRYLGGLGAPVLLVLGNHDLHQRPGHPGALRCYLDYAEEHPDVVLPERNYVARLGPVLLPVFDTNRAPEGTLLDAFHDVIDDHRASVDEAWVLLAGHHPIRTYRDNGTAPEAMRRWFGESGLEAHAWFSGHAHFQQLVVVDDIPQVTTGAGSRALSVAACGPDGSGTCGPGERWSGSDMWGYAVATVSADTLHVAFKDLDGQTMYAWSRDAVDPQGR